VNNRAALTARLPQGVSILTDPVYAHLGLGVRADIAMVNLAYRPASLGWIRPVVGLGLGAGYGTAYSTSLLSNAFIGSYGSLGEASSAVPALQAFAGVDVRLSRRLYLSVIPRLLWVSAKPVGVDQSYTDAMVATSLGYRF